MPTQSNPAQASAPQSPTAQSPASQSPAVAQSPAIAGSAGQPAPIAGSPEQVYRGLREKRSVLGEQKNDLEDERGDLTRQLRSGPVGDADRSGLEQRLAQVDQAIAKVSIDIAETDAQVAQASSVPGAIVEEPPRDEWANGAPPELVAIGMGLLAVLLFPIMIARARRLWRSANVVSAVPPELVAKMATMERGIDAIAVEVERIGEGQRFVTQLLAERADAAQIALPRNERK